jgi:hypothetical protein
MKIIYSFLILVFAGCVTNAHAQLLTNAEPVSFRTGLDLFDENLTTYNLPLPDMTAIAAEDAERASRGELPYDGRRIPVSWNPANAGEWFALDNGDMLWKMKIAAPGAVSLELYFDDFYLPEGAELYMYSADHTIYDGGYTAVFNQESGYFATNLIDAETIIVEYYEPAESAGKGRLQFQDVGYRYRDLAQLEGRSDPCQVDINCPEGDEWQDQKKGVVRLRISESGGGTFWCTAGLMNNTALDCTPYMLTAFHCIDVVINNPGDLGQLRFFYNYERPGCDEGNAPATQIMLGASVAARSQSASGNGSDFCLFELNSEIPENYTPYYNGWNLQSTNISGGGVGIHHPSGDSKKISTSTQTYVTSTWAGSSVQAYWRVFWAGTESGHGVTEGGSSGSPLFDQNGLVVGTLTGGSSYCNEVQPGGQNQPDWYGKMSFHWDLNNGSSVIDLKTKLDPLNTGQSVLLGTYAPCDQTPNSIEETVQTIAEKFRIFPNPTSGILNFDLGEDFREVELISVYNIVGKLLTSIPVNSDLEQYDLQDLPNGLYIVNFEFYNGEIISEKVARF